MSIRIAIVEDDSRLLGEICLLLADSPLMEVTGRYATGKEAVEGIIEKSPDVALIDLGLPDISGLEVISTLRENGCKTEFLVLTVYDDDEHLFPALKAGAVGYIVKEDVSLPEVVGAIEQVINGGAPMSRGIAKRVLDEFRKNDSKNELPESYGLTKRELEILDHLAGGLATKKVADTLCISYETIRSHQKNIYRKLQVNSMLEAVAVFRGQK